jgi:hypothetical protein
MAAPSIPEIDPARVQPVCLSQCIPQPVLIPGHQDQVYTWFGIRQYAQHAVPAVWHPVTIKLNIGCVVLCGKENPLTAITALGNMMRMARQNHPPA